MCQHQWAPLLAKLGRKTTATAAKICLGCGLLQVGDLKVGNQTIRISKNRINMDSKPIKNLGAGTVDADAARRDDVKAKLKVLTLTNQAFAAATVTNISFTGAYQYGKILKIRVEKNPTGAETGYVYLRFYADATYTNEISQQYSIDLATADIASQYVCHVPLGEGIPYALDATTLYAKVKCQNAINLDIAVTIEEGQVGT